MISRYSTSVPQVLSYRMGKQQYRSRVWKCRSVTTSITASCFTEIITTYMWKNSTPLCQQLIRRLVIKLLQMANYRGADKSLPEQEGNKPQRQKILSFIYPIYNHNWSNISSVYTHNKISIKRNILTTKQNISG
jgi:hypothetical protein